MDAIFLILAILVTGGAVATMALRNLIHCALSLAVAFGGLAMLYLKLNAAFIGFTQLLVYVGAVAILIVFAILLTRSAEDSPAERFSASWGWGILGAVGTFAFLTWVLVRSDIFRGTPAPVVEAGVREIGNLLMTRYVLPLQVIGLLLTVALIGAVILAMPTEKSKGMEGPVRSREDAPNDRGTDPAALQGEAEP